MKRAANSSLFNTGFLPWKNALMVCAFLVLTGCANGLFVGETPAQRAYELEAAYNIVLESALDIAEAQPNLRAGILNAEAAATPVIEGLSEAFADYEVARAAFASGETTAEQLAIVAANLDGWISQAQAALVALSRARAGPD